MHIDPMENVFVAVDGVVIAVHIGLTIAISSVTRLRIQFAMDGLQETVPSVLPMLIEIVMVIVSVTHIGLVTCVIHIVDVVIVAVLTASDLTQRIV
jgi:hypothetical protein